MKIKKIISSLLVSVLLASVSFFSSPSVLTASTIPSSPALFETSLSFPVGVPDTAMTLQSTTLLGGASLPAGYACFTVDQGLPNTEYICGTVAGTAVLNLVRGIDPLTGYTSDSNLIFSHRRGADVKITDFPVLTLLRNILNGQDTLPNAITYSASTTPVNNQDLTTKAYVLSVVNGGPVTLNAVAVSGLAGETVSAGQLLYFKSADARWYKALSSDAAAMQSPLGISQGSGTAGNSITNGILVRGLDSNQSGLSAGSNYYATTTAGSISTATSSRAVGRAKSITELYFDTTFQQPSQTGDNTFTGTNTFTGQINYSGAATVFASSSIVTFTASSTYSKPSNLKYISIEIIGGGGAGGGANSGTAAAGGGGGGGAYLKKIIGASLLTASTPVVIGGGGIPVASATGGNGQSSAFGSFATSTGGLGGTTTTGGVAGSATGGDLNISGQDGGNNMSTSFSGKGGDSILGSGGQTVTNSAGKPGSGYGGGGGGAQDGSSGSRLGGSGSPGIVIITQYFY